MELESRLSHADISVAHGNLSEPLILSYKTGMSMVPTCRNLVRVQRGAANEAQCTCVRSHFSRARLCSSSDCSPPGPSICGT